MQNERSIRIPGLDGLRALSIIMVLSGHLAGTRHCYSLQAYQQVGDLASLGVRVFFIISGFLITKLLLKEHHTTGTISVKGFYIRRTLRIFPAFYTFLLVMVFANIAGYVLFHSGDMLHAVTYTVNYHYNRSWWIGHTWSLSVEEQFYLLWPATLLLLGIRRGLLGAFGIVLFAPLVRLWIWYLLPSQRIGIGESFPTIADTIATGCLLAGIWPELESRPWFGRMLRSRWFFVIPCLALALNRVRGGRIRYTVLESMLNVLIAFCIARCVLITDGIFARVLNSKPLVLVGIFSYSLYLWQQPFLNRSSRSWIAMFPVNIVLAVSVALVCHYAVEKPCLTLRRCGRRVPVQTPISVAQQLGD